VFCAAGNALLKRRRARLLCDAYAAGHASVLQAWRHHVTAGMPDVIKFIDQLRAIVVTEFAAQDAADATAIAVKVAANKAAKEANKVVKEARKLRRQRSHTKRSAPPKAGYLFCLRTRAGQHIHDISRRGEIAALTEQVNGGC
jgi:hypothetical protein